MTIATALIEHALLHIALLDLAGDVLAIGHGDDAADQDIGDGSHGDEEQDE